jgi:hypothetical protein
MATKRQSHVYTICYVTVVYTLGSSVGIATGHGLDDRGTEVRLPAGVGNFSLLHCVQTDSGAHPAFYPMGTGVSFHGGKAAGAWS